VAVRRAQALAAAAGPWAPLYYCLAHSLFIALAFPATLAFETAAGVVFGGLKQGVAIVTAAKILGAALGFVLGRTLLRSTLGARAKAHPRFGAIYEGISERGWVFVALLRLSPLPSWMNNYGLAATNVRFFPDFIVPTSLASLPCIVQNVLAGLALGEAVGVATTTGFSLAGVAFSAEHARVLRYGMPLLVSWLIVRTCEQYSAKYQERLEADAEDALGNARILSPEGKPPPPSTRTQRQKRRWESSPPASPAASPSPPRSRATSSRAASAGGATAKAKGKTPAKKTPTKRGRTPAKAKAKATPARSADSARSPSPRKRRQKGAGADANNDGHTTRSEARAANVDLGDARDLNDDGRVTRSEARAVRRTRLA
jgi:uncharacterized membrane protein YdjX (TVP38/TMEM64 family)